MDPSGTPTDCRPYGSKRAFMSPTAVSPLRPGVRGDTKLASRDAVRSAGATVIAACAAGVDAGSSCGSVSASNSASKFRPAATKYTIGGDECSTAA